MTISVEQFRVDLPEFSDAASFPDSVIQYWIDYASVMMTARWGASAADHWPDLPIVPPALAPKKTQYDFGMEMLAAHNISLEARAISDGASGGIPGSGGTGSIQSKSVDKASVSYDTQTPSEANGGNYNLTIYGTRFLRLARFIGAGAIQVNTGPVPSISAAWSGPLW